MTNEDQNPNDKYQMKVEIQKFKIQMTNDKCQMKFKAKNPKNTI